MSSSFVSTVFVALLLSWIFFKDNFCLPYLLVLFAVVDLVSYITYEGMWRATRGTVFPRKTFLILRLLIFGFTLLTSTHPVIVVHLRTLCGRAWSLGIRARPITTMWTKLPFFWRIQLSLMYGCQPYFSRSIKMCRWSLLIAVTIVVHWLGNGVIVYCQRFPIYVLGWLSRFGFSSCG